MQDAKIELAPYSPAWPEQFAAEAAELRTVLAPWLAGSIEHIGSTAVPGLTAKPVIDIMAPVRSLSEAVPAVEALAALAYVHFPYKPAEMLWFCKPSPAHRTHHLHLVAAGGDAWHRRLAFRDALRRDPSLAVRYAELKRQLAAAHAHDRDAYTEAKSAFVEAALRGGSERAA